MNIIKVKRQSLPYDLRLLIQNELEYYLCQAVLTLRDRDNKDECIILQGIGDAIQNCIIIAEVITKRIPNIFQITEFFSEEKQQKNSDEDSSSSEECTHLIPGIKIKLTYKLKQGDINAPGFQKNIQFIQDPWKDLTEFSTIYRRGLIQTNKKLQHRMKIELETNNTENLALKQYDLKDVMDNTSSNDSQSERCQYKLKTRGCKRK